MSVSRMVTGVFIWALLSFAASAQEPMTFEVRGHPGNYTDAEWIAAEGRINSDTPQDFLEFIEDPNVFGLTSLQIVFHSSGGELGPALELGRIIRANGMRTAVGFTYNPREDAASIDYDTIIVEGTCESSCAWAFMGGVGRTVRNDEDWTTERIGRIGIHQFYQENELLRQPEIVQSAMGELLFYLVEMGIDPGILGPMSTVLPDEMYYLSAQELNEFNVENTLTRSEPDFALIGGGLAWYHQVTDNLGAEVASTYIYCENGGLDWIVWHRELGSTDYQARDMYGLSEDLDAQFYEIDGQRIDIPLPLRASHGDETSDGWPDCFLLALGPRLVEFPGETLGLLQARNFEREVIGWRFPNMLRTLPNREQFNVLLRTCPST